MTRMKSRQTIPAPRRKIGVAAFLTLLFALLPFAAAGTAQAITIAPPHGQVYNGDSPRCLDSGTTSGALLFNCSTSIYQQWTYDNVNTNAIIGNSPKGCLDDGAGLNGSRVVLTTCTDSLSQRWISEGGEFVNEASGKCLDADLGTIGGQATIVQVWSCSGAPNQIWTFQYA